MKKFKNKFAQKISDMPNADPLAKLKENEVTLTHQNGTDEKKHSLTLKLENRIAEKQMRNEDFERLAEIGSGSAGTVYKVRYKPVDIIMAQKIIRMLVKSTVLNQIIRELDVLKRCQSKYIVSYFGSYEDQGELYILMEFMDGGSLDHIFQNAKRIPEKMLGKIVHDVVQGLSYLRLKQSVIHRDIKPQNILLNTKGEVKICDFGVSGTLIDSMANTFVGTRSYMAPERLEGKVYNVRSDIWSIGLLMVELSIGRYPYPPIPPEKMKNLLEEPLDKKQDLNETDEAEVSIFELLDYIVSDEPPKLPQNYFSEEIIDFVSKCLLKNPAERADLDELLNHRYIKMNQDIDIKDWVMKYIKDDFNPSS